MNSTHFIEPLENRIAPTVVVTFTDLDGDLVKISASKGTLAELQGAAGDLTDHRLQTLDLSGASDFDGADISITATPQHGKGDGLVNVGRINATGRVLGSVIVKGDLGVIDAGDTSVNAVALQSLAVQSIGEYRLDTGAPDLTSDLVGSVKSITVKGDVRNALINITGADPKEDPVTHAHRPSSLGSLSIGGSLLATNTTDLGSIKVAGDIGPIKVGGSVISGGAQGSAQIGSLNGSLGSVTIGGDLIGGVGGFSGYIYATTNVGNVFVGGDVRGSGGSGSSNGNSGLILAGSGSMGTVKIGGSLIGGAGAYCGSIDASTQAGSTGSMGAVTIGHSVIGGGGAQSALLYAGGGMGMVQIGGDLLGGAGPNSGLVQTGTGDIAGVSVHGSMLGGGADYTGSIAAGASGTGTGKLGPVVIRGNVTGGSAAAATRSGLIDALGDIKSVSIGGSLTGGGGSDSGLIDSTGSLGAIKIGGDVAAGQAVRTGRIYATANIGSITIGRSLIGGGSDQTGSIEIGHVTGGGQKVGPITIGGSVIGGGFDAGGIYTQQNGDDFFGAIKVGGDWKGGSAASSGRMESSHVTSIFIGGSLIGGSASFTGEFDPTTCGTLTIEGDVIGGSSTESGVVDIQNLKSVTIGGSIIGGSATQSGIVFLGHTSSVVIGHDLRGGSSTAADVDLAGALYGSQLDSVKIGGSLIAGQQTGSGHLTNSGSIGAVQIGSVAIKGSLVGNAASSVQIVASGNFFGHSASDVALKSLTVGGRVEFALIAVGLNSDLTPSDADAQIGAVKVAGDWIASSLLAGVNRTDGRAGDGNDVKLTNVVRDEANVFSKIASITIGGQVAGKLGDPSVTYGFGAEEIGAFKVSGVALPLKPGKFNDNFAAAGVAGNALPVGASPEASVNDGFAVHIFEVA